MNKTKIILFALLLFLCVNVHAEETCKSSELSRLKELAKKVELDYDYTLNNGKVDFSINATNLNKELMVLIIKNYYTNDYREFTGETQGTLTGFKAGEKVTVTIKAFVPNACSGNTVLTKSIKLPYYNHYYSEEKCSGNEDFKYCKILIDKDINESEFNRQYELYIKNKEALKPTAIPEAPKEEDNMKLYIIIGGAVLALILIIILTVNIIKRREKNRL